MSAVSRVTQPVLSLRLALSRTSFADRAEPRFPGETMGDGRLSPTAGDGTLHTTLSLRDPKST